MHAFYLVWVGDFANILFALYYKLVSWPVKTLPKFSGLVTCTTLWNPLTKAANLNGKCILLLLFFYRVHLPNLIKANFILADFDRTLKTTTKL